MALTNGIYKGKGLSLKIDAVEYNMDATNLSLQPEDKEVITFADLATGAQQWFITGTFLYDPAPGSLWRYIWDNALEEDVAFIFYTHGTGTAGTNNPIFTGTLTVPKKQGIAGDANSQFEFEARFDVDGEPLMDITP